MKILQAENLNDTNLNLRKKYRIRNKMNWLYCGKDQKGRINLLLPIKWTVKCTNTT